MTMASGPRSDRRGDVRRFFTAFFSRGVIVRFCFAVLAIFALLTIFADWVAPYPPNQQDLANVLRAPSAAHWLGQDDLGRDVLSRMIYGGRVSLSVSVLAGSLAAFIGIGLGLVSGYVGGAVNRAVMAMTDVVMSVPNLVFSLVLVAIWGGGWLNVVLAIALGMTPTYTRMINGLVLALRENDYIVAGRLIGLSGRAIVLRHLLPNCLPSLTVLYTINLGNAVLLESTLSYLGVGVRPPTASWGSMVSDVYPFLLSAPWLVISPGLCIVLIIISFNVVGDSLRDALDPRLRGKI